MRRVILFLFVVALMLMMLAPAALADHNAGPCSTDSGEPGNSDFAAHNIVVEAKARELGAGAHIPGAHRGVSGCDPSGG